MRVLYLAHRVPYAPNRGGRIRAFHTLRYLREQQIPIHLIALAHDADEAARADALKGLVSSYEVLPLPRLSNLVRGGLALPGSKPLTHALLGSPAIAPALRRARERFAPDVVLAFCSGMARFAMGPPLADLPFVLDMVDVDSAKWAALARTTPPPLGWIYAREADRLRLFERAACASAAATLVVSERELDELPAAVRHTAHVVPNGIDAAWFSRPADRGPRAPDIVFTAVFDYPPNEEGALWFARECWPHVRSAVPGSRLLFVGANPVRRIRALAEDDPRVVVTGSVPDVRPYLWDARVAIAPLFTARGVQNKVLEALAAGLPVVTTPAVADGLPWPARSGCEAHVDPRSFASAVERLLTTPQPDVDVALPQWSQTLRALLAVLTDAVASRETPPRADRG